MGYCIIDEAWSKVAPADLLTSGYHGAFTYISRDASKCASDEYISQVLALGLGLGFVFEDSAGRWRGGAAAGVADGQFANGWADAHHLPDTLPLYAAIDQSVSAADMPTALAYVAGFGSVKRPGRGYGSFAVVEMLSQHGIDHDWQTCAWSGGQISSHAAIYQRLSHTLPNVAGSYDEDPVLDLPHAGLWFTGADASAHTPPPAQPLGDVMAARLVYTDPAGSWFFYDGMTRRGVHGGEPQLLADLGLVPQADVTAPKWLPANILALIPVDPAYPAA